MKTRKAQSTVISTVLIILLVIALVAVLAYVVNKFVTNSANKISYNCQDLSLTLSQPAIDSVTKNISVIVTRGADSATLKSLKLLVFDGTTTTTREITTPLPATQGSNSYANISDYTTTGKTYTIKVAGTISDDKGQDQECDVASEIPIAA